MSVRRRVRDVSRLLNLLVLAGFAGLFVFICLSNQNDWDFFFSTAEVDKRAWLLDHSLPLWSYQLCGGVTRLGDPQQFGLSPLFAFVLLFGSFVGLKLLALALSVAGFFFAKRLFELLLAPGKPSHVERNAATAVSASWVLGNFFLWHLNQGQVPFSLVHLAMGALYGVVRAYRVDFGWRWALALVLLVFTYLSSAPYHSFVFWTLPAGLVVVLAGGAALLSRGARLPAKRWGRVAAAVGSCGVGASLAGYKLAGMLHYQAIRPRVLTEHGAREAIHFLQTAVYQTVPTLGERFAGVSKGWGPWGAWEYSAFSVNAWLALAAGGTLAVRVVLNRARPRRLAPPRRALLWGAVLVALVYEGFALGDGAPSLYGLLNLALHGSMRVLGRYGGLLALGCALFAAFALTSQPLWRRFLAGYGVLLVPLCSALNLASFHSLVSSESLLERITATRDASSPMNTLVITRERTADESFMFGPILLGAGVLNCYDPIVRSAVIAREFVGRSDLMDPTGKHLQPGRLPLVDPFAGTPPESCLQDSHFTQNQLVLAPSCPLGTCVNLNEPNPQERTPLRLDPAVGKYCLAAPGAPEGTR